MKDVKAIFFDIDGTLVSFDTHTVPQSTTDALNELRSKGIKIFIATGRMLPSIGVVEHIPFDGYITYNGGYCVTAEREEIFSHPIPQEDLDALVNHLKHDPFPVSFMTDKEFIANYMHPRIEELAAHIKLDPPRVQDPQTTIQEETVYQICIYVDEDKSDQIINDVFSYCDTTRWISTFADVNVRGISKQTGIDKILEYYNIDLENTMAFGDGGNDITMLQHVGIGVAMGNAKDEVKAIADYVTDSVDEDGICKALSNFGLL
jgi:Cof subfamily protein (haloacid dehalogenase superfamily)